MMQWNQGMKSGGLIAALVIGLVLLAGVSSGEDGAEVWSGELAVAITAQSGTTDTFSGSIDAKVKRAWGEIDLVSLRFTGVYGTSRKGSSNPSKTDTIQNSQSLFGRWKHTIDGRFFWATGSELTRDGTQDLKLRAALSTGPAYRLWMGEDPAKHHFDVSAGPGYRYESYDGNTGETPPAENSDSNHFVDLVAAFEYKNMFFEDRIEYSHTGSGRVPANDPGSYILRSEMIVGVPITGAWSFRTSFLVEFVADPGPSVLNKTTTRTSVGLGYKF